MQQAYTFRFSWLVFHAVMSQKAVCFYNALKSQYWTIICFGSNNRHLYAFTTLKCPRQHLQHVQDQYFNNIHILYGCQKTALTTEKMWKELTFYGQNKRSCICFSTIVTCENRGTIENACLFSSIGLSTLKRYFNEFVKCCITHRFLLLFSVSHVIFYKNFTSSRHFL